LPISEVQDQVADDNMRGEGQRGNDGPKGGSSMFKKITVRMEDDEGLRKEGEIQRAKGINHSQTFMKTWVERHSQPSCVNPPGEGPEDTLGWSKGAKKKGS